MKKIFSLIFLAVFAVSVFAQLPVKTKIHDGSGNAGTIMTFNKNLSDTLKSGDTIAYRFLINHSKVSYAYISELTKLVANDTTVYVKYFQSVDGSSNLQQLRGIGAASAPTYNDTIAKSTTTGRDIDLYRKNPGVPFSSQYFIIWLKAPVKSGFKTILYGSTRINEY
jgi:hypothetical protein